AFDQPRNVRHYKATVLTDIDNTEVWIECRERVISNLGPGRRNGADQGRFAGVRQPEQADIRNHLHLELERTALAWEPRTILTGRTVGARLELLVAPTALSASRYKQCVVVVREVTQLLIRFRVSYYRADGHRDVQVLAALPEAVIARSGFTVLCPV